MVKMSSGLVAVAALALSSQTLAATPVTNNAALLAPSAQADASGKIVRTPSPSAVREESLGGKSYGIALLLLIAAGAAAVIATSGGSHGSSSP